MIRQGLPKHAEATNHGCPACIEVGSKPIDMLKLSQKVLNAAFARSCSLVREAGRHRANLARGKARCDQVTDTLRTAQVGFRVAAVSVFRAAGIHQASVLVMAQHALRDSKPFGCFLDLHFDPFPHDSRALTLVSMSSANFFMSRGISPGVLVTHVDHDDLCLGYRRLYRHRTYGPNSTSGAYFADVRFQTCVLNPKIQIILHAADRFVDVIQEGFDIAIRAHHAPFCPNGMRAVQPSPFSLRTGAGNFRPFVPSLTFLSTGYLQKWSYETR